MKDLFPEGPVGPVAVFPLPSYVLFPHTLIPFHIFEPRYRKLTADCLAGSRLIVVAGLQPGWQSDYHGTPPVFPVAGLGKIVNEERLEDGRYNIFVHGLTRVEISGWSQDFPYRVAEVRALPDTERPGDRDRSSEIGDLLRNVVVELAVRLGGRGAPLTKAVGSTPDLSMLTNRLASMLVRSPEQRQQLLETRAPVARAERLVDVVSTLLLEDLGSDKDDADPGLVN